jgi:hypothetical protein|tara:strand:+ start:463 stop:708 length:246 start_codon:yes stop_codon:yes gene_type:complete
MQSNNTRQDDKTLKETAKVFENIGWEKRLCDLSKEQVLGIIAKIQSMKGLENEYTEQGVLELQQEVENKFPDDFPDDEIPF